MRLTARHGVLCVAGLAALSGAVARAGAAPRPIRGELTRPGYTVIALAANGEATSVRARRRFRLRPPAPRVTLHLRTPGGGYGGPVVIGRERQGRRAILGVRAGARLGRIAVRRGHAAAVKRLSSFSADPRRWARARRGIPTGAGNFGFVRSRPSRGAVAADSDLDGVPDALDVDDDGNRVLDDLDRAPVARAAQPESSFNVRSALAAPLWDTANANATTLAEAALDRTLQTWGRLILELVPGDSAELDCGGVPDPGNPDGWSGGLVYCTRGGTGTVVPRGPDPPAHPSQWPRFPGPAGGPFDADGDGMGTLAAQPTAPGAAFFLAPGAATAQMGTGDVLIQRVVTGAGESQLTLMLPFVFVSTPALAAYSDGQGNAAMVGYPVAAPIPGPSPGPGGPGTDDDPFPVRAGGDGDVVVSLTFWRPQRRPIPPDPVSGGGDACLSGDPVCDWIDIGELTYSAAPATGPGGSCPQEAFSADPTELAPAESDVPYAPGAGGLVDLKRDGPANAANTLTYTLNLTRCLRGLAWEPGDARSFNFGAVTRAAGDVSVSETVPGVTFALQP